MSFQYTEAAKHYGITVEAAAAHLKTMLESGEWDTLTGFDRACIGEVMAERERPYHPPIFSNTA